MPAACPLDRYARCYSKAGLFPPNASGQAAGIPEVVPAVSGLVRLHGCQTHWQGSILRQAARNLMSTRTPLACRETPSLTRKGLQMRRVANLAIVALLPFLMAAEARPPILRMKVTLVAGRDGGKLTAGELGWAVVSFRNTSKNSITVPCALFQGKGANATRLNPSYSSFSVTDGYYVPPQAFSVARFVYAFVSDSTEESSPDWRPLPPPDGPMEWKPGESRDVWRLVRAPKAPGRYKLKIKFSNDEAVKTPSTFNYAPSPLPDPIVAEAAADKVKIAAKSLTFNFKVDN